MDLFKEFIPYEFIVGMNSKIFYDINTLQIFLLEEFTRNDFIVKMH